MSTASTHDVTRLLLAWSEGDPAVAEHLLPLIYEHLRTLAHECMRRESGGHTLQATVLVHEAYLRLVNAKAISWQGRAHFYSLAARAMRRILVDHARARQAQRRGGQQQRVPLEQAATAAQPTEQIGEADFVALDAALNRLMQTYERPGQVVELRFFGGMEVRDIAEVLQVTERTVWRDWQLAKLWLHRELGKTLAD
jgi:RNA polymerase sigma-70 factor (ECF subfamily)